MSEVNGSRTGEVDGTAGEGERTRVYAGVWNKSMIGTTEPIVVGFADGSRSWSRIVCRIWEDGTEGMLRLRSETS